jgi:hypothetical protein
MRYSGNPQAKVRAKLARHLEEINAALVTAASITADPEVLAKLEKERLVVDAVVKRAYRGHYLSVGIGCIFALVLLTGLLHFIPISPTRFSVEAKLSAFRVKNLPKEQTVMLNQHLQKFWIDAESIEEPAPAIVQSLRFYSESIVDFLDQSDGCVALTIVDGAGVVEFSSHLVGAHSAVVKMTPLEKGNSIGMCDKDSRPIAFGGVETLVLGQSLDTSGREFADSLITAKLNYSSLGKQFDLSKSTVMIIDKPEEGRLFVGFANGLSATFLGSGARVTFRGPSPRHRFEPSILEWLVTSPDVRAAFAIISALLAAVWKIKEKIVG